MKRIITVLALFLSVTAQAQFEHQGTSPQNETLNLNASSIWTKSFAFKNIGGSEASLNLALSGLDSSKFIIAKNRCNVHVSTGKTCVVTLSSIRGIQKRLTPYSCPIGSSIQTFVSRTCDPNYSDNGSVCVLTQFAPFAKLAVGDVFSCVISSSDKAYCWGRGVQGQLGNGTTSNSLTPSAVLPLPN